MYCVIIIFLLIFCVVDGKINGEMEKMENDSHCSNMCQVLVRCVSVSRSVNVPSNKVSVVVVFHKKTRSRYLFSSRKLSGVSQTSCARLVKVLIVVALCEVGL